MKVHSLNVSTESLRHYINKLEILEKEKVELSSTIKDVFDSAKGDGFDVKTIRQILKIRRMNNEELAKQEEEEILLQVYKRALGMDNTIDAE